MNKFTCFDKFDELLEKYDKQLNVLNEAIEDDEDENDNEEIESDNTDGDDTNEPDPTMPADESDAEDPTDYASPERGVFMSDNQKAEYAKMLLTALMANPPETGTIPAELMNVSVDNADQVMKVIQSYVGLDNTNDNEQLDDNMANQLKHAGN